MPTKPPANLPGPLDLPAPMVEMFNESNDRSLINLLHPSIRKTVLELVWENDKYFNRDENDLYKQLRADQATPTPTDHRLRYKFWIEYDRVQGCGANQLVMSNVLAGVCTKDYFFKHYITNPYKVAWLLCPPANYQVKTEEALTFALDQLRDMLTASHMDGDKLNTKVADIKIKIFKILDDRVNGMALQRVEEKSVHAHLHASTTDKTLIQKMSSQMSEVEMNRQLEALEARNRIAQHLPDPKTIEAEELSMREVKSDESV